MSNETRDAISVGGGGAGSGQCGPNGKNHLRVLVTDDNREAAESLSALIDTWGHEVLAACEGATALELAVAHRPDVLLLDLIMPVHDGCHVARMLRQHIHFKHALLIVKIACTDEERRLFCKNRAFDLFNFVITKPIDPFTLQNLLLLEKHRLANQPSHERDGDKRTLGPAPVEKDHHSLERRLPC